MFDDSKPIFQQIADTIANDIVRGTYNEEDHLPSTNELAVFYRINPATAAKGLNLLVDQGIAYKKRGIGMFVAPGARRVLHDRKKNELIATNVQQLVHDAHALGIDLEALITLITQEYPHD
ncbi:GntR family transcriptional regulator [Jonesia quinghaiensis]|uniref:GntR family transcriptional regulator n=1 Tax=Jonesia quinghaiensis TaxID=262806 RepID=UPI0004075FCA|nr:GntR family transcriptional regulator [Jonesia quinghaiensis]